MKKPFLFVLIAILLFCFAACEAPQHQEPNNSTVVTTQNHDHTYELTERKEPGCEEQGEIVYTCACGHSYTEYIKALGHNYISEITKQPLCNAEGEITYFCSCGHSYKEATDPAEHSWGNWFVDIEPTYTTKGQEKRMCTVCRGTEIRELGTNNIEQELKRFGTLAQLLPVFQAPSQMTANDLFHWVRIRTGSVSSDFNNSTFQVTNIYSLEAFDTVTQLYFGQKYDFVSFAQGHTEITVDAEKNQLIWVTYGAGGWLMTAMDSYTKIDDTHYSIRYYSYDYDNVPVSYGTLNLRLTDHGFVIESHANGK